MAGFSTVQQAVVPEPWVTLSGLCPKASADSDVVTEFWHLCVFPSSGKGHISTSRALC